MSRFALFALLPLCFSLGCDLAAKPFAGTVIQMTLNGATTTPANEHLELWARNQYNDTLRVTGIFNIVALTTNANTYSKTQELNPFGFVVRPAITMDDPCMIVTDNSSKHLGALLTKAEAYDDATLAGVHQTAEEQAQQVRTRIGQLTPGSSCDGSPESMNPMTKPYHCGLQGANTLYGTIAYELVDDMGNTTTTLPPGLTTCEAPGGNTPGCIPYDTAPADRLAACKAYWANDLAYTPSPLQLTAPLHGQLYGEVYFLSITPAGIFDSIRIDSNVNLLGIQELWMTVEPDQVDVLHRGPIFLDGTPDLGGREIVHFDLTPPFGTTAAVSGAAALEVDLDEDPVQF
jgi:hypothetical protein